MSEHFSIQDIEANFPGAIVEEEGVKKIDYKELSILLAEEVADIKDQLLEKDYQITKIFERIERLSKLV